MRRVALVSSGLAVAVAVSVADGASASARTAPLLAGHPATGAVGARLAAATPGEVSSAKRRRVYVTQGPRFNLPSKDKRKAGALDLYIKSLIRHAPPKSEIDVAVFRLREPGMAKELVAAKKRKVKVRVVVDHDSLGEKRGVYNYLARNLGTSTKRSSWITLCPANRGCIAPSAKGVWGKNHNKFYAFSRTFDSRNVVVQTSGNATGGMYATYNDAYTLVDSKLYRAYRWYFYALAKHRSNGNFYRQVWSGKRAVSFFPKANGDPIVDVLNRVQCWRGTKIRLSSGIFSRTEVAQALARLDDQGCDVQVVAATFSSSTLKALAKPGRHGGANVHYFTGSSANKAHSKYLLIDGYYNGKRHRLILTGSHSYTVDALRHNDEAMLALMDSSAYSRYTANFAKVFGAARGKLWIMPGVQSQGNVPTSPEGTSDYDY
ncbi:phospholipase D-like domain-containing protein [Actinomadura rupiterrae]|uniref:phospholipase D-like domain-containing protein n=1 Tax=Actinomadura rupiterrae TaxID=559627 RepID=UPI0020A37D95|nr:phospholipase D-like domain-containing protein [Actinomadura rupiterrae]MCP2335559.1 phosphatidylserine/phosphatidylglycerophosphate/cardiolipin synthase-like enzyme [Actinomadura rupiterrae]